MPQRQIAKLEPEDIELMQEGGEQQVCPISSRCMIRDCGADPATQWTAGCSCSIRTRSLEA